MQHQQTVYSGKWEKSGVSEHSKECHGYFDWMKVKTLKIEPNDFKRKVREAIEIQYHQTGPRDNGINQDDGQYVTTTFWKPLLKYVRNQNENNKLRQLRQCNALSSLTNEQTTSETFDNGGV